MKVKQSEVVAMFEELGYKQAAKWKAKQLKAKTSDLHNLAGDLDPTDYECGDLLTKLLKAAKAGTDVEIVDDSAAEEEAKPAKKSKAKAKAKAKKKAEPEPEAEDEDDDEVVDLPEEEDEDGEEEDEDGEEEDEDGEEEDEETVPVKPKKEKKEKKAKDKKGKGKASKAPKGPGVIASIVEFLKAATEKKPIKKEDMVAKLAERFPDRDADSMAKTVAVQVPNRIKKEQGVDVRSSDKGYWIAD